VTHVWLLDPISRSTRSASWAAGARCTSHQGDVKVRAAPFEAIELDLTALWSKPRVT
jgi:hypothetical protein